MNDMVADAVQEVAKDRNLWPMLFGLLSGGLLILSMFVFHNYTQIQVRSAVIERSDNADITLTNAFHSLSKDLIRVTDSVNALEKSNHQDHQRYEDDIKELRLRRP